MIQHRIGRIVTLAVVCIMTASIVSIIRPATSSSAHPQNMSQNTYKAWLPLARVPFAPFDPAVQGFSFPNYTRTQTSQLSSVEMRRLFGDAVCGSTVASDGTCTLTPPATNWMDWANSTMNYGNCEGMAIVSSLMFNQRLRVEDFGANRVSDLVLAGNTKLQREIAYWSATVLLDRSTTVKSSPNAVLAAIRNSINAKGNPFGTLRFSMAGGSGGHSVLPLSVRDLSSTTAAISVYDSNYPGQTREIVIDTAANTWFYSPDANLTEDDYRGDSQSKTIGFAPIEPRLGQQACSFCAPPAPVLGIASLGSYVPQTTMLAGDINTIPSGVSGTFSSDVNAAIDASNKMDLSHMFPSAPLVNQAQQSIPSWKLPAQPFYTANVTDTVNFGVRHIPVPNATTVFTSALIIIGPGFTFEIGNLGGDSAQVDQVEVAPGGKQITYTTGAGEVPKLFLGFETPAADFGFWLNSFEMESGDQVVLDIDAANKLVKVRVNTTTPTGDAIFSLQMERIDSDAIEIFASPDDGLTLANQQTLLIDYSSWQANGQPLRVGYDDNNNGLLDAAEVFTVQDNGDVFDEE